MKRLEVSQSDVEFLRAIRSNVERFMSHVAARYGTSPGRLLDVAPQDHSGARPFFAPSVIVETFDIDPGAGTTYVGDLCRTNPCLAESAFDYVVCTEVLEHTLDPFAAVREMHRILKPGGLCFVTTPFNFRIHGPLPDCWRFTEHGLRALFASFEIVELSEVCTPGRNLMPIQYSMVARKGAR